MIVSGNAELLLTEVKNYLEVKPITTLKKATNKLNDFLNSENIKESEERRIVLKLRSSVTS